MSEQDEIARQEYLDQQKFLELERLFIGKFLDLAEHLGCKPEDLNVDLVLWHRALIMAETVWSSALANHYGGEPKDQQEPILNVIRQCISQVPHDTVDRADKE